MNFKLLFTLFLFSTFQLSSLSAALNIHPVEAIASEIHNDKLIKSKKVKSKKLAKGFLKKKPLSTLSFISGLLGLALFLIPGSRIGLTILAAIFGLTSFVLGLIGIHKEGRGLGALGMFFGGIVIVVGLLLLIGQLMG